MTYDQDFNNMKWPKCEDPRCPNPQVSLWYCVDCDSSFCSDCWPLQGAHRPGKVGRDGVPHQKVDRVALQRLMDTLNPSKDIDSVRALHEDDEQNKWFGVVRDSEGRSYFEDYKRYDSIISDVVSAENATGQYPQLVSFIGVTNAGKSTLIKMLIEHGLFDGGCRDFIAFPSPVVGSTAHENVATSSDVHLYADPLTHKDELPILYADCEGFEGGEKQPLGSQASRHRASPEDDISAYVRPIRWANTDESRRREYAVASLYPRLLYTFSACVVFVLRNAKTFQSAVLTKLLDWGAAAVEKSLNQPALPHCVVILNGTELGVDKQEWDTHFATRSLLSTMEDAFSPIEGVPRFRELAQYWRHMGKPVTTIEDLILCYYSSFKVIRIPISPHYTVMDEQIGKLHATIRDNCARSNEVKKLVRMNMRAEQLNVYLQSGFDHFTTHLDIPFNFMQISLLRNPIPLDFGGHILNLYATISDHQKRQDRRTIPQIFEKLSDMVASCILLDYYRFRVGELRTLFSQYKTSLDGAMADYLKFHCPCAYKTLDGNRKCILINAGHTAKGHQDEDGIFGHGPHIAEYGDSFVENWKAGVKEAVSSMHNELSRRLQDARPEDGNNENAMAMMHVENMHKLYSTLGPARHLFSHTTCLCCLMGSPEHILPCKHVLCDRCLRTYGEIGKRSISLRYCPLHPSEDECSTQATFRIKPEGASVRVLSLDGGGMRNVIQLEILRAIELELGGHMHIQSFFDLLVGTGAGGLIAAALAIRGKTVQQCMEMFTSVCKHTFTTKVPIVKSSRILSRIRRIFSAGYKTQPLHTALKDVFTEDSLFFGSPEQFEPATKVAVTSVDPAGDMILLANYRRPMSANESYSFERSQHPEAEIKTWQGVAATMANPAYFKPFVWQNKIYMDGAMSSPNPIKVADREARLMWGAPDLCISLGTGQDQIDMQSRMDQPPSQGGRDQLKNVDARKARWSPEKAQDILRGEIAWQRFLMAQRRRESGNFIRWNPDLEKEPPAQDSQFQQEELLRCIQQSLQAPHRALSIKDIAHRLVATCFFLETRGPSTGEDGGQTVFGRIACCFDDHTSEIRGLGSILDDQHTRGFEPHFLVRSSALSNTVRKRVTLTHERVQQMREKAVYNPPPVSIPLLENTGETAITLVLAQVRLHDEGSMIGGFPRFWDRASSSRSSRVQTPLSQLKRRSSLTSERYFAQHPALASVPTPSLTSPSPISSARSSESSDLWPARLQPRRKDRGPVESGEGNGVAEAPQREVPPSDEISPKRELTPRPAWSKAHSGGSAQYLVSPANPHARYPYIGQHPLSPQSVRSMDHQIFPLERTPLYHPRTLRSSHSGRFSKPLPEIIEAEGSHSRTTALESETRGHGRSQQESPMSALAKSYEAEVSGPADTLDSLFDLYAAQQN